jgi:PHD/YefM family antitoxin component YafN of YafNO toxin-antitoxin module
VSENIRSEHRDRESRDMKGKARKKEPEIVIREGKPSAVILDIDEYQEMLERLEDMDDLRLLEKIREKPLKFRKIDDFLMERSQSA